VASTATYDAATRVLSVRPAAGLAAGAYVVELGGLRDSAGARPPEGLGLRFTVGSTDATAPDTGIISGPSGITRLSGEPFTRAYASEPLVTFQCSYDTGPWADCPPDKPPGGDLPNGAHTFRVRAVDGAGRTDATPATRSWTIDRFGDAPANDTADGAIAIQGPSGSVQGSSHRAELEFAEVGEDDQGGRSIWYRWTAPADGTATFDTAGSGFDTLLGVFEDGSPPIRRGTSDDVTGALTSRVQVRVRAGRAYLVGVDGFDGQSGAVTLAWSFAASADGTAPQTTITDGPRALVADGTSDFAFAASEPGATFECALDEGAWFACEPPESYTFWIGQHTLRVRATDAAGNTDATPASWTWSVDRIAPSVFFRSGPGNSTTQRSVSYTFEADEPGVTFECRLDRGAWAPCSSPRAVTVTEPGPHELDVRGTDPAGHTGDHRRATWVLLDDAAAPDTAITAGPPPVSRLSTARVTATATEAATIECRLDAGAWGSCAGWSGLAAGAHTIDARARDTAGNVDPTPATRAFTVDATAPVLGDFDADGAADLAAGMPGEGGGGGAVLVLPRGAAAGSRVWSQNSSGVPESPEPGDAFGSALAVGDFDADGYDDLAIGAPGEDGGAGTVHVLRGSPAGLTTSGTRRFTQATAGIPGDPDPGDGFGAALAAGRFDAGESEDLAIGAPGEDGGGAVHVLPSAAASGAKRLSRATADLEGSPATGFGTVLASGDLGGDARADLAVGSPEDGAGAVNVLLGGPTGITVAGDALWTQDSPGVPDASEPGDRFGAALAVGPARALVVGAPGEGVGSAPGAGAITVLGSGAAQFLHEASASVPGALGAGHGFGSSVAVTRPRGAAPWLGVGAPGERVSSYASAGSVSVLGIAGGTVTTTGARFISQSMAGVPDVAEPGDGFGSELAPLGPALAVGAAGEDIGALADAGAVTVLPGAAASGATFWSKNGPGVAGSAAAGDRLGVPAR
jgi:hypothetical protein